MNLLGSSCCFLPPICFYCTDCIKQDSHRLVKSVCGLFPWLAFSKQCYCPCHRESNLNPLFQSIENLPYYLLLKRTTQHVLHKQQLSYHFFVNIADIFYSWIPSSYQSSKFHCEYIYQTDISLKIKREEITGIEIFFVESDSVLRLPVGKNAFQFFLFSSSFQQISCESKFFLSRLTEYHSLLWRPFL